MNTSSEAPDDDWGVSVSSNVATFDDALIWIVRKVEECKLPYPIVHVHPYWDQDEETGEYTARFGVQISGNVDGFVKVVRVEMPKEENDGNESPGAIPSD